MASEEERRNLQRCADWERRWNEDLLRMVAECYAPDGIVHNMLTGDVTHGRDELGKVEHAMAGLHGPRRMEITRMVASGDKVAVQMDIIRQGGRARTCAFLTFDENGLIKRDNWYGEGAAGRARPAA